MGNTGGVGVVSDWAAEASHYPPLAAVGGERREGRAATVAVAHETGCDGVTGCGLEGAEHGSDDEQAAGGDGGGRVDSSGLKRRCCRRRVGDGGPQVEFSG